ncbi:hypothetical protein KI387_009874, partial [Taxus chinensis]
MAIAIRIRNTGFSATGAFACVSNNVTSSRSKIWAMAKPKLKQEKPKDKGHNGKDYQQKAKAKEEDGKWGCVSGCGACCKLAKGPSFAPPEDIFMDVDDIVLYWSMTGPDGWCVNYNKITRTCSIYSERPYFCRVEPDVFKKLYGIDEKKFNKEACG